MKNLIITHRINNTSRGAYFIAKRLSERYSNLINYEETNLARHNNRDKYNKLIFNFQNPSVYNRFIYPIKDLIKYQDVIFIRERYNNILYNSFSNGFYYWKNSNIKSYFPIITFDNNFINKNKNYDNPIIGIYPNIACNNEIKFYSKFIKENLKYKYIILGYDFNIINDNIINTFDNNYFFNNITHFLYAPDKNKLSPFPNTLLEAVLSNTIPIVLGLKDRLIKDGATEICEVINYLDEFNLDKYIDNSDCILHPDNFNKFYNNNLYEFEGFKDKTKFKNFNEFLNYIL